MNRREFLGTSLSTGAVIATTPLSLQSAERSAAQRAGSAQVTVKKLPIGVFNPPFRKLSLDEMLDKFSGLGIEAVVAGRSLKGAGLEEEIR
jgi:hypothetical protein